MQHPLDWASCRCPQESLPLLLCQALPSQRQCQFQLLRQVLARKHCFFDNTRDVLQREATVVGVGADGHAGA